jgi:hypothetical protein
VIGTTTTLTASVTISTPPLSYQWQHYDGSAWVDMAGETAATCLVFINDVGSNQWRVQVSNSCGNATGNITITGTAPTGGSTSRVTWDAAAHGGAGGYVITHDPRDGGLFFKYGSVVGIYTDYHKLRDMTPPRAPLISAPWDAGNVVWTPTGATYTLFANIPYTTGGHIDSGVHTPANVKAGRGDPCRLTGLDLTYIAATPAGSLTVADIDNGLWRLPNIAENEAFLGLTFGDSNYTTTHWWSEGQSGSPAFGVVGAELPRRNGGHIPPAFMPAVGQRLPSGAFLGNISMEGQSAGFWIGENLSPSQASALLVTVINTNYNFSGVSTPAGNAYPVRCVPNTSPLLPPTATVSPSTVNLTGANYHPTLMPGEVLSVTSSTTWTLVSNHPSWLQLTLNSDGSGAGTTINGSGNQTVYLVVAGNPSATTPRTGTISLGGQIGVTVNQGAYDAAGGGYSERITWDAATGTYILTTNFTDAGLYFRFGSVVGIFSSINGLNRVLPSSGSTTQFNAANDIAWSPVNTISGTGAPGWVTIPYAQYVALGNPVIDAAYHTVANVKAGLGDPCRLVGMNLAYIQATPAGSLTLSDIDNGAWQLPTDPQNTAFTIGSSPSGSWWTNSTGANPSPYGPGVPGSEYPLRNTNGSIKFLPANGMRNNADIGEANHFGAQGRYWGRSYANANEAYALGFNSSSNSQNQPYLIKHAFGVRCVRQ